MQAGPHVPSAMAELFLFGANYASAPVEFRERLAALFGDVPRILGRAAGPSAEALTLATCNRVELYVASGDTAALRQEAVASLVSRAGLDPGGMNGHVYVRRGFDVVRHLFRVATGLDSLVLGESEVLGQVSAALAEARERGTVGPLLTALVQRAVRAGRRVRSETGLGRIDGSVGVAAVELAFSLCPDLARASVVVVGAGKMGEVALRALERRGATDVQIVGRTPERVACLAGPTRRALLMHELSAALARADVVISATAAPHPVITPALLEGRSCERPLVVVDIAVPRDVDPAVGAMPGVRVYDIDDLSAVARRYRVTRRAEARRAERIVEEEALRFADWLRERRAAPAIAAVHRRAEAIRRAEVERLTADVRLGDAERRAVEAMSAALVKRLLHDPFVRLKRPEGQRLLPAFEALFSVASCRNP